MHCLHCNNEIDFDRAQAIVDFDLTQSCIKCSKTQAPAVFMNYDHKTAGTLFVVPNNPDGTQNEEKVRQAKRCFNRER